MALLGEDFSGGTFRRMFRADNPAGLATAIAVALGLIVLNQLLQLGFALLAQRLLFGHEAGDTRQIVKAGLVGLLPASLLTAICAVLLARLRGGSPLAVLNLRWPRLGALGWPLLVSGFIVGLYAAVMLLVSVLGIDLAQYTPGPHGESPQTGSAGLVKEAMFDIANDPRLFLLVLPSVGIGAPLAEELIFRGQIFTALSRTRLGFSGITLITSAAWALMHYSEPWLSIAMIFLMGLAFGYFLYRFGSLWVTMICHSVWNLTYSLLILVAIAQ